MRSGKEESLGRRRRCKSLCCPDDGGSVLSFIVVTCSRACRQHYSGLKGCGVGVDERKKDSRLVSYVAFSSPLNRGASSTDSVTLQEALRW